MAIRDFIIHFEYDNGFGAEYVCLAEVSITAKPDVEPVAEVTALDIRTPSGSDPGAYLTQCCAEKAIELAWEKWRTTTC